LGIWGTVSLVPIATTQQHQHLSYPINWSLTLWLHLLAYSYWDRIQGGLQSEWPPSSPLFCSQSVVCPFLIVAGVDPDSLLQGACLCCISPE
jgi:hypothetical protein